MAEPKAVRLSDIKFAKPNPPPQPDPKLNNTQPDPAPAYPINNQTLFSNPHLKPFERLAADKPGEELAPEGVIWQMYAEEAKEHDSELVESENNNLDMMLLFVSTDPITSTPTL
ncbi:hypothetical protein FRC09_017549 [Ceratobasidium sp. 395]|nr:hypothetical protein FRC09_017549 [Ceratobasidium sp. 395]